jgi:hypothetical protein
VKTKKILVKGSSGLIGSEAVKHFDRQGHAPNWRITRSLDLIFEEIITSHWSRQKSAPAQ